jgi:hypothetical protein
MQQLHHLVVYTSQPHDVEVPSVSLSSLDSSEKEGRTSSVL